MFWNKCRPKNHTLEVKKGQKLFNQRVFNPVELSNIYKLEADILQHLTMSNFNF